MAKKVKCIECENSMDWDIPPIEQLKNDKWTQEILKETIVCGYTMKTKNKDHCQYCKHYKNGGDFRQKCRESYEKELNKTFAKAGGAE